MSSTPAVPRRAQEGDPDAAEASAFGRQLANLGLVFGILTLALGIFLMVWHEAALTIVAVLFGLQLIVLGALRIASGAAALAVKTAGRSWC